MSAVSFHVVGLPAPQGSKRHVGNGIMVESSKAVKPWREAVVHAALALRPPVPLDGPLGLRVAFTLPKPKSATKARWAPDRKPDLSKLVRSTEDAMTVAGIWTDDARVIHCDASKVWWGHSNEAMPVTRCRDHGRRDGRRRGTELAPPLVDAMLDALGEGPPVTLDLADRTTEARMDRAMRFGADIDLDDRQWFVSHDLLVYACGGGCYLPAMHQRRHLGIRSGGGWKLWPRSTVTRALVPIDPTCCPVCASAVSTFTFGQLPLIRHGGYGAVETTTRRDCTRCGWALVADVTETSPR